MNLYKILNYFFPFSVIFLTKIMTLGKTCMIFFLFHLILPFWLYIIYFVVAVVVFEAHWIVYACVAEKKILYYHQRPTTVGSTLDNPFRDCPPMWELHQLSSVHPGPGLTQSVWTSFWVYVFLNDCISHACH